MHTLHFVVLPNLPLPTSFKPPNKTPTLRLFKNATIQTAIQKCEKLKEIRIHSAYRLTKKGNQWKHLVPNTKLGDLLKGETVVFVLNTHQQSQTIRIWTPTVKLCLEKVNRSSSLLHFLRSLDWDRLIGIPGYQPTSFFIRNKQITDSDTTTNSDTIVPGYGFKYFVGDVIEEYQVPINLTLSQTFDFLIPGWKSFETLYSCSEKNDSFEDTVRSLRKVESLDTPLFKVSDRVFLHEESWRDFPTRLQQIYQRQFIEDLILEREQILESFEKLYDLERVHHKQSVEYLQDMVLRLQDKERSTQTRIDWTQIEMLNFIFDSQSTKFLDQTLALSKAKHDLEQIRKMFENFHDPDHIFRMMTTTQRV
jgi:hypothetical protein